MCDLDDPAHDLPHVLVNIHHGITWKVLWPMDDDDPDVKRYHAIAQVALEEDEREMGELSRADKD